VKANDALGRIRKGAEGEIDIKDLTRCFVFEFGGNKGLAKAAKKCFDQAPEGSAVQSRMISDIAGLIKIATTGSGGEDATEEDLEAELKALTQGGHEGE